ncbi:hypothetical protein PC120_g3181 [Phytophthora cactorum]|nr:hypothetical protein PC120_g3181 [Phytophthora cactorum]
MYATLGIDQDDDGDEDFIYEVEFARREEREEEEAEKLPSDFVKSLKAAHKAGSQRKQKGASAKRRKNSQSIDAKVAFQVMVAKESTPVSLSRKKQHSPHVPSPSPRKKLKEEDLT